MREIRRSHIWRPLSSNIGAICRHRRHVSTPHLLFSLSHGSKLVKLVFVFPVYQNLYWIEISMSDLLNNVSAFIVFSGQRNMSSTFLSSTIFLLHIYPFVDWSGYSHTVQSFFHHHLLIHREIYAGELSLIFL